MGAGTKQHIKTHKPSEKKPTQQLQNLHLPFPEQ